MDWNTKKEGEGNWRRETLVVVPTLGVAQSVPTCDRTFSVVSPQLQNAVTSGEHLSPSSSLTFIRYS